MENASKALIIAGAILLSILIISLGIMVYNNSKNTVGSANLSKQEIATFNSEWESYCGGNKTASEVSTMISAVIASNAAESRNGAGRLVTVQAGTAKAEQPSTVPTIASTSTYRVEATYGDSGLITNLKYTANGSTSGTTGGGTTNPLV